MPMSTSSTRQVHTVLGGGIRYETVELVLATLPHFELKQKGRVLHLFAEVRIIRRQQCQLLQTMGQLWRRTREQRYIRRSIMHLSKRWKTSSTNVRIRSIVFSSTGESIADPKNHSPSNLKLTPILIPSIFPPNQ